MRVVVAIAIALCVIPGVATGQSRCANAVTQIDLNTCAAASTDEASARRERLLDKLRATPPAERVQSLATVQRQWSDYMEAQCRWESDAFKGGSIQPMLIAELRHRSTVCEAKFAAKITPRSQRQTSTIALLCYCARASYSTRNNSNKWRSSRSFMRPLAFLLAMISRRLATGKIPS